MEASGAGESRDLSREGGIGCDVACQATQPYEPCVYTVRVTEPFKGNLARDVVIEVPGPDVSTSCGEFGRRLHIGTSYVVGIGGPCSPFAEWTEVSMYTQDELDLLRDATLCVEPTTGVETVATSGPTGVETIATSGVPGPTGVETVATSGVPGSTGVETIATTADAIGGAVGVLPAIGLMVSMLMTFFHLCF